MLSVIVQTREGELLDHTDKRLRSIGDYFESAVFMPPEFLGKVTITLREEDVEVKVDGEGPDKADIDKTYVCRKEETGPGLRLGQEPQTAKE